MVEFGGLATPNVWQIGDDVVPRNSHPVMRGDSLVSSPGIEAIPMAHHK